ISMALAPFFIWLIWPAPELIVMQIVISAILFWRHRSNITNLISGAEGKISESDN
ncbi:MAG: glycerol-3-phosphate acyltransferase, partial [Candidatus Thiodiazotropha weberae]|nr:glycerol-3-phosphate acyltransferase [Candidatus Thiodiazotropha lotti]MCW4209303.1 glycerol-3-phosphate acyltransferase [Candidatus Thiodiazotropha lotti]